MKTLCVTCWLCWWLVPQALLAQTITLQAPELNESSGVGQIGHQLWSHNDSGDGPRLFVFQLNGVSLGEVEVVGAKALDWEDMCTFTRHGRQYVAIGDVGDNSCERSDVRIYVIEVPESLASKTTRFEDKRSLPVAAEYCVTYPEGAVNCEALAYDPHLESFVLATKETLRCRLYYVRASSLEGKQHVAAQLGGTLVLPLVTGGDISPDGSQLVLATYGPGCLLGRPKPSGSELQPGTAWRTEGEGAAKIFSLPNRKQGESICFSSDGSRLLLTSEFVPTPLLEVAVP